MLQLTYLSHLEEMGTSPAGEVEHRPFLKAAFVKG
ncbi:mCG147152 [Mus musculus]|nr:mCG147152 [Mus musculus]